MSERRGIYNCFVGFLGWRWWVFGKGFFGVGKFYINVILVGEMEQSFEFLEHTADIKFKAWGKTMNACFESSVLAFADYVGKGNKIHPRTGKVVDVSGSDKENLLYNFMDELVYLLDHGFVVSKAMVDIQGNNLKAELFGDSVRNYKGLEYVKAATYSEMYVRGKKGKWELQVVLDV